jgi:hypothetical protein
MNPNKPVVQVKNRSAGYQRINPTHYRARKLAGGKCGHCRKGDHWACSSLNCKCRRCHQERKP